MAGRGRPKGSTNKKKEVEKIKKEKVKLLCTSCGEEKNEDNFYMSYSKLNRARGRMNICKDCLWGLFNELSDEIDSFEVVAYYICMYIDSPFYKNVFLSAIDETQKKLEEKAKKEEEYIFFDVKNNREHQLKSFQTYMTKINSLPQYRGDTFRSGESIAEDDILDNRELEKAEEKCTDEDKQNEKDVIRILGFDPFEDENAKDRRFLFNRMVNMLTDDILDDNIKLMAVISVIKSFNQIDNVDNAIAKLTKDTNSIGDKAGNMKTLVDVKKNLSKSALDMCDKNGLSEKKTTGSGTLTAKMKEMHEIRLDEEKANLYDIRTSDGMRQVADMSNDSIINRLRLAENDYADIVADQRDMVRTAQAERDKAKEDLRLALVELDELKKKLNVKEVD